MGLRDSEHEMINEIAKRVRDAVRAELDAVLVAAGRLSEDGAERLASLRDAIHCEVSEVSEVLNRGGSVAGAAWDRAYKVKIEALSGRLEESEAHCAELVSAHSELKTALGEALDLVKESEAREAALVVALGEARELIEGWRPHMADRFGLARYVQSVLQAFFTLHPDTDGQRALYPVSHRMLVDFRKLQQLADEVCAGPKL